MRRIVVSPAPSDDHEEYTEGNSIDEVEETLNNLDDELDDLTVLPRRDSSSLSSRDSSPYGIA